jgi:ABC-type nickel/cobalt efflux system permease component RcnA
MLDSFASLSTITILGVGLVFGLKHATEVDHVIAVSTIVSQHKNVFRSALVGLLWGAGHTASLLLVGGVVLALRVAIPEQVSQWLEFGVAIMIIGLGFVALRRALRGGGEVHMHQHTHNGLSHMHIHFHENETKHEPSVPAPHSHAVSQVGWKPVLIGAMHGLAGSGALTVLVLTQISSTWIGFVYLAIFGLGSIVGMIVMSGLIGLPFALSARHLTYAHHRLQTVAAVLSICFGAWYAYASGAIASVF